MAQRINVALNSIPSGCRDLAEFAFFCGIGFTFGSLGLIWLQLIKRYLKQESKILFLILYWENLLFLLDFSFTWFRAKQFFRSIRNINPTVSPTQTDPQSIHVCSYVYLVGDSFCVSQKYIPPKTKMTNATYKRTALKVLVLWNLPALILLAGAFQVGTSVIV